MSLPNDIPFDQDDSYKLSDEKKPKKEEKSNGVVINVRGLDDSLVQFKIKRSTALGKLMNTYCEKKNYDPLEIKFLYDGQRVLENSTAESLRIANNDEIDVVKKQDGGSKLRS